MHLFYFYSKRFHTTSLEKVNSSDFELGTYTQDEEIEKTELNGLTSPPVNDYVTDPTAITCKNRNRTCTQIHVHRYMYMYMYCWYYKIRFTCTCLCGRRG